MALEWPYAKFIIKMSDLGGYTVLASEATRAQAFVGWFGKDPPYYMMFGILVLVTSSSAWILSWGPGQITCGLFALIYLCILRIDMCNRYGLFRFLRSLVYAMIVTVGTMK